MQESDKRIFEIYLESNFLIYVDDKWSDGNISILLHMNINISMFFLYFADTLIPIANTIAQLLSLL